MTMITGRFSPLPTVSPLNLSSALFGMRVSLRGKRRELARLAWLANGSAATSSQSLQTGEGCEEHGANVEVLAHRNIGGFKALNGTILPNGQGYVAYTPLGMDDRNPAPRTTKYRCWSPGRARDSRK